MPMLSSISIPDTDYSYDASQVEVLNDISTRVQDLRQSGTLSPEVLRHLRKYFRIKNVYHSNAIEGNQLDVGETQLVVEQGLTITGKPLKDQAEAKNLSEAIEFLEDLAGSPDVAITETDIRQLHTLVLMGIDNENAGKYRSAAVQISGSKYVPPGSESVPSKMKEFGDWLAKASIPNGAFGVADGLIIAAVAHTWFVTIHPFIDGNGRVARLLMNLMLMRFRYPIAIISKEDRIRYYDALEESQASDLSPMIALLCECVYESLEEYEKAAKEQLELMAWSKSIASKFAAREITKTRNEYEVWKSAMELHQSYFMQIAELITNANNVSGIGVRDFGMLEFEKYLSLKSGHSVKKTWFFRADFRSGAKTVRYLFYFGFSSYLLRSDAEITLFIAREEPPGSFHYERLDNITAPNVPDYVEIGYSAKDESFVARAKGQKKHKEKIEQIARKFFADVIQRHFSP